MCPKCFSGWFVPRCDDMGRPYGSCWCCGQVQFYELIPDMPMPSHDTWSSAEAKARCVEAARRNGKLSKKKEINNELH